MCERYQFLMEEKKKTTAELSAQRVIESPPSARRPPFEGGQISLQQKARKAFSPCAIPYRETGNILYDCNKLSSTYFIVLFKPPFEKQKPTRYKNKMKRKYMFTSLTLCSAANIHPTRSSFSLSFELTVDSFYIKIPDKMSFLRGDGEK